MASFEAKIGWKGRGREKIKIIVPFRTNSMRKGNSKKIAKKFKKLKNTIMAAFQAKTDWKTLKKRENKNYRFVSIRRIRDISKKIAKKFKKLKNTVMASFQHKIGVWKGRKREKIKIVSPFHSNSTSNWKFQKKKKKNQKIKKYHCGFIPSQNRLEKAEEWRK